MNLLVGGMIITELDKNTEGFVKLAKVYRRWFVIHLSGVCCRTFLPDCSVEREEGGV